MAWTYLSTRSASPSQAVDHLNYGGVIYLGQGLPVQNTDLNAGSEIVASMIQRLGKALGQAGFAQRAPLAVSGFADNTFTIPFDTVLIPDLAAVELGHTGGAAFSVVLDAPPSVAQGARWDSVFVEFWWAEVAPLGTTGSVSSILPSYGDVQDVASTNDISTNASLPTMEASHRVQLQWRIRTADGTFQLDDGVLTAWGAAPRVTSLTYTLVSTAGNPYYVAGSGSGSDATTLNTITGRVYALPICRINRRPTVSLLALSDITDLRSPISRVVPVTASETDILGDTIIMKASDGTVAATATNGFLRLTNLPELDFDAATKHYVDRGATAAGVFPPLSPGLGQYWIDTSIAPSTLNYYTGSAWQPVAPAYVTANNLLGNSIASGTPVHLKNNGSGVLVIELANASDKTKPCHGLTATSVLDGNPVRIITRGVVTIPGLTLGASYYLGTTDGTMTTTPPTTQGQLLEYIGIALDGTTLLVNPQLTPLDAGSPATIVYPIGLTQGGTGAITANAARANLGAAAAGTNGDITALAGLTTAVTIAQGGTGATDAPTARTNLGIPLFPLAVANGGTGATTLSGVRTAIGAAASGANSDITSLSGLTTVLSPAQGGTGVGSIALLRTALNTAQAGANNDITSLGALSTAITIAQGGTGATTSATARNALSAAASGANSDITSLTALSTPLSIAQGGTGGADAATARTNLGVPTLSTPITVAQGGTSGTTAATARTGLGINFYDIAGEQPGKPTANLVIFRLLASRAFTIGAGALGSVAQAATGATASTTFTMYKVSAGVTTSIGTFNFAAGGSGGAQNATFTITLQTALAVGDLFFVQAPGTVDATLADLAFTVVAALL